MTVELEVGDPPEWLGAPGKDMWKILVETLSDTMVKLDRGALTLACAAYSTAYDAAVDLSERGPLVQGDRGMVKNPAAQIARESGAAFKQWCNEFGLTPAARKRLSLKLGREEDAHLGLID
jgi:P27 family predicted phage terminase small subunit